MPNLKNAIIIYDRENWKNQHVNRDLCLVYVFINMAVVIAHLLGKQLDNATSLWKDWEYFSLGEFYTVSGEFQ